MSGNLQSKTEFAWVSMDTDGQSVSPAYTFESENSLGFYRSTSSTIAQSYGTLVLSTLSMVGSAKLGATTNGASTFSGAVTVAASGYTGTALQAFSMTTCVMPVMTVQGSASSFTIFVWPAVRVGDAIQVSLGNNPGVSSLSSGLVLHSHCTQNGQCELRISNVSTLVQIQSAQTLVWYRWSAL